MRRLSLVCLDGVYAVCRLPAGATVPDWATRGGLWSLTRTPDELSVLCAEAVVPAGVRHEPGWRCLRVAGTLPLGEVGVVSALAGPLAEAGVSVFVLSSFDTDYLFVRAEQWERAVEALRAAGHEVRDG
jgi:hypothetical protein